MNLQVMKWLLKNRDLVTKVLEAVKGWSPNMTLTQKWEIVAKVAALVVPVLDPTTVKQMMAAAGNHEVAEALSVDREGVELLGVDWPTMVRVIVPIISFILQVLNEQFGE
ncbi:MAG: hypothetical protein EBT03_08620 [Betaproteobacteria bacterium]|nr:hypothetical protein [Betaproteobacteria bacterium]NCA16938.1 hypothetical protein [Betaproteobacteria bacterium]